MEKGTLQKAYEKLVLDNLNLKERLTELKIENGKLNIILYHRENGLSHADFNAEIEISKQSERIAELEAVIRDVCDLINNSKAVSKWKIFNWLDKAINS